MTRAHDATPLIRETALRLLSWIAEDRRLCDSALFRVCSHMQIAKKRDCRPFSDPRFLLSNIIPLEASSRVIVKLVTRTREDIKADLAARFSWILPGNASN